MLQFSNDVRVELEPQVIAADEFKAGMDAMVSLDGALQDPVSESARCACNSNPLMLACNMPFEAHV